MHYGNMGHMANYGNMQQMPPGGGYTVDGEIPSAISAQVYYQQNLQMAQQMSLPMQQQGHPQQGMGHPQQQMPQQQMPQQQMPQQQMPQQQMPQQQMPQQQMPQQQMPIQGALQQGVTMQEGATQSTTQKGGHPSLSYTQGTMAQNGVMGTMQPGVGFMPTLHSQGNVMRYD